MKKQSVGVGLMGLGVVGGQVARVLIEKSDVMAEQVGCPSSPAEGKGIGTRLS